MKTFSLLLLILLLPGVSAQTPAARPAFLAADVHISPPRKFPFADGGKLFGDRYILRQATMVDLISKAYKLDAESVQGGPSWLEMDRFDVIAKAPPKTPDTRVQLMLQSLLADRFHLVLQPATRPMPAYVLRAGKAVRLTPAADPDAASNCQPEPPASTGGPQYVAARCNNLTTEQLASNLHQMAGGYLDKPVVDQTGLTGVYDVEIKWSPRGLLSQQGSDGISIFDAVDKELGLKLTLETAPRPVLAVQRVDRVPTPNVPDIDKLLPPPPAPHFDVATIKPSRPDEKINGQVHSNILDFKALPLRFIFAFAFDLNPNDSEAVVNLPHNFATDAYDVYAKLLVDPSDPASAVTSMDNDEDMRQMLQAFLIERFAMKFHYEDRPITAYNLVAVKPSMHPAAPDSRTHCIEGAGAGGADPRLANSKLNRLVACQNMTMTQLGEELQHLAPGYIYNPVKDETGLAGGYDFTLSFSSADLMGNGDQPKPDANASGQAADPNGALSLPEAVRRQLGLKLDKVKRPARVLVIDHIEPKPTEN